MRFSPFSALLLSFFSWLSIGIFLLYKGLKILVDLSVASSSSPFLQDITGLAGGRDRAVLFYIFFALFIGFIKGRFVLSKTVNRLAQRFSSFGGRIPLKELYPAYYLLLIGFMMLLGLSLRWIPIFAEVRGIVDVAVGSALINGAMQYFRLAFAKGKNVAAK